MPLIKRYSNRKYYNTVTSKYVTLEEIGDMVLREEDVQVVDHASGADLTALVLSQVIYETGKKIGGMLPEMLFSKLIRKEKQVADSPWMPSSTTRVADEFVESEIRRRLQMLSDEGSLTVMESVHLAEMLVAKRLRLESGEAREPTIDPEEIELLKRQVEELEKQAAFLSRENSG